MKEQESRENELKVSFAQASKDIDKFKTSMNFRLNLEKSRVQILRKEHFIKFDASNVNIPEEVKQLKALIESQDKEIKDLRALVENNPLLSEKHAKVLFLEENLRNQEGSKNQPCLNQVFEHVN